MHNSPTGKKPKNCFKDPRSPFWQYDFRIRGERERGSTGERTAGEAAAFVESRKAMMRKAQADLRNGLGQKVAPPITLIDACARYETWLQEKNGSVDKTTKYQIGNLSGLLCPSGGDRYLHDITTADLSDYRVTRKQGRSNRGRPLKGSTINREIELARRVWMHASREGFTTGAMPEWRTVIHSQAEVERERELSADEQNRLFETLGKINEDLLMLAVFAMLSGQRKAAVVKLRWSDIDFDERLARVLLKTKGPEKREHSFPLTERMLEIIKSRPRVSPFVFTYVCTRRSQGRTDRVGRIKGERYPFSLQGWNRQWRKALRDAGISNFRWHDLRHTAATRLLRSVNNLKAVQELLGHRDIAQSARYAHVFKDDLRAMMQSAEAMPQTATQGPASATIHEFPSQKRA